MESYENNYPSFEKPIESNINEDNAPAPSAFPPPSPPIINDIYLESTENNYHDVSQMKSIIALTNEKEMCDIIIKYKKDNNFNNYDIWNKKSEKIDAQLSDIFSLFNSRVMNNTRYIRCIQKQLEYEKNLLNSVDNDKSLKEYEKPVIKERIQKRIDIINDELNNNSVPNQIKQEKKEQIDETENKIYTAAMQRYKEYKSAYDYFVSNGLTEKIKETNMKVLAIASFLQDIKLQKKSMNKVLPPPLEMKYIYGYSEEQRWQRYQIILTNLIKQKEELKEELKKSNISKRESNQKLINEKINQYDSWINTLYQQHDNKKIPAPLYSIKNFNLEYEKENENIPKNTIIISISNFFYNKEEDYLLCSLNTLNRKEAIFHPRKDIEYQWTLQNEEFDNAYNNIITIEFFHKSILGTKPKYKTKMELYKLKNHDKLSQFFSLIFKDTIISFTLNVKIRKPIVEQEYYYITKEHYTITKLYPEFIIKEYEEDFKIELSKNDIEHPDNLERYISLKVIDDRVSALKEKLFIITDEKEKKDTKDNISFLEERKQQLIEKLNKANKPVKYLEMLKQLYLSEMKLKEYFIANNNRNTSVFIGNRIDLLMEDIQDLEKKFNL